MGISFSQAAVVANPGQQVSFSSLLSTSGSNQPEYVVLLGLDRDRYSISSNGNVGTLAGNGQTFTFKQTPNTDSYNFGVVFTSTDKGYYNSNYGYLADLTLKSSTDNFRNETLSLYGFGQAGTANAALYDKLTADINAWYFTGDAFMHATAGTPTDDLSYSTSNYIGTLDVVTRTDGYKDATPNVATPNEIVAVARSYVGAAWNLDGCWVLANNIAAVAGASLPLTSNQARTDEVPPVANGEWIVAYDSANATPAEQAHWAAQLRPGDIVVANNPCGGHVLTAVSGSGYATKFIDNSQVGFITDIHQDVTIQGDHAMPAWALGPDIKNITIYRLDTPIVTVSAPLCLNTNTSHQIASLFTTSDPAGKAIVSYQLYDAAGGSFSVNGALQSVHSADTAITVDAAALATVAYVSGASAGVDTIQVRAFNGSYWGDWQSIDVAVGSSVQAPVVQAVSDTVYLHGGKTVSLASMFNVSAPDSAVTSYTITMPISGGYLNFNGAADLGGGKKDADGNHVYEVSAQDFSKLLYVSSPYTEGVPITVMAHNGAALPSNPTTVVAETVAVSAQGISHYLLPGQEVPLSALFAVTQVDDAPVQFYGVMMKEVVLSWGDGKPSSGGTLNLHGATDLLANVGAPIGDYEFAASDLGKLTFTAAPDEGGQFMGIYANDGGSSAPALAEITTVSTQAPLTAHSASIHSGAKIALSSLFSVNDGSTPVYYRIIDPTGGGSVQMDPSGTNLIGKNDATPGLYIVNRVDLEKLSYIGGDSNGTESISITTSQDFSHWNAEVFVPVSTVGAKSFRTAAGSQGNDVLFGSENNDVIDGGAGINTVVESGTRDHFTITKTASGLTVIDKTGAQGTDTLSNIERIRFDDKALAFDTDGGAGQLYRLYQAAFDRAPDATGFGLWLRQMDAGTNLVTVADGFMQSAEFAQLYGSNVSDSDFVAQLYKNVLHRTADTAGFNFWVNNLAGGMHRDTVLTSFSESPENYAQVIGTIQNGMEYIYTA